MEAEDVIELYSLLLEHGVQVWIDGGWGIDALLGRQTRPHKDMDAFVHFDDLATMTDVLAQRGFTLKEIWSENRWLTQALPTQLISRESQTGHEVATAFVLRDGNGRELDFHVVERDGTGSSIPVWNSDLIFTSDAFEGHGSILNTPVRCLSAQMHMVTHTGYTLLDKDLQDLRRLHERFGIAFLEDHVGYIHEPSKGVRL